MYLCIKVHPTDRPTVRSSGQGKMVTGGTDPEVPWVVTVETVYMLVSEFANVKRVFSKCFLCAFLIEEL